MVQHVMELNQQVGCVSHHPYLCCCLYRCSRYLHTAPVTCTLLPILYLYCCLYR